MEKIVDLFLSHNNADKPWTERLAAVVEADRSGPPLKVFFDKWDIPHGGDIPAELEQGLQNSRYVGLVLSPEPLSSDWVTLERSTAIHRDPRARQRSLIPLLRRTCDIPDMLARLKYIDFRREQDFNGGSDQYGQPVFALRTAVIVFSGSE
jgi:TIR domain